MARRTLLIAVSAVALLIGVPTIAIAELFDTTEPETVISKVHASKKGTARVHFTGSDPVDSVEDLTYDCAIDPGSADDEEEEDPDDHEGDDEDGDEGEAARNNGVPWEIDCVSPWTAKGLEPGRHTVEVIAFDDELNEDATPALAAFKVKKKK
jgi:hypothetical protein